MANITDLTINAVDTTSGTAAETDFLARLEEQRGKMGQPSYFLVFAVVDGEVAVFAGDSAAKAAGFVSAVERANPLSDWTALAFVVPTDETFGLTGPFSGAEMLLAVDTKYRATVIAKADRS